MGFLRKTIFRTILLAGGLITVYTLASQAIQGYTPGGGAVSPQPAASPSPSAAARVGGVTAWGQLVDEARSEVGGIFGSLAVQLALPALAGALVGGGTVYKLYPAIQRVKVSRRVKAAQRRLRAREEDERLLAEASG